MDFGLKGEDVNWKYQRLARNQFPSKTKLKKRAGSSLCAKDDEMKGKTQRQTERKTQRQTERKKERQAERKNTKTNRKTDIKTDRKLKHKDR
jgi:hypothetical protein